MSGKQRQIRYRTIADDLRGQIDAGELAPGAVLPSEADLAAAHDVSRVTVRKALEVLRDDGLVDSRQGFGWFVAGARVRQSLGVLSTIEQQLTDQGRTPVRKVIDFTFDDDELVVRRLNLADGQPFAIVTVWCPAELGSSLSRDDVESATFYELLPIDFSSATQTIGADVAGDRDALLLEIPTGSPLLVVERVSHDEHGNAALRSEHRFPAHLTEFVVDLPGEGAAAEPTGLRLVQP